MFDHFHFCSSVIDHVQILLYGGVFSFFVIKDFQSNGMDACGPIYFFYWCAQV